MAPARVLETPPYLPYERSALPLGRRRNRTWLRRRHLKSHSPVYKTGALPLKLRRNNFGAGDGTRTRVFGLATQRTSHYTTPAKLVWCGWRDSNSRPKGGSLLSWPLDDTSALNLLRRQRSDTRIKRCLTTDIQFSKNAPTGAVYCKMVGKVGLEPTITRIRNEEDGHFRTSRKTLVWEEGFEPPSLRFQSVWSTRLAYSQKTKSHRFYPMARILLTKIPVTGHRA